MTWTFTNLLIQVVAGIVGAHLVAATLKEYGFGAVGHTVAGAAGGAFSGYFLQSIVATVVTSTGELSEPDPASRVILQVLAGIAAGAIVMLAVGLAKHVMPQHEKPRR